MKPRLVKLESDLGPWFQTLLLMEEIRNNHLGCMRPCKYVMGYLPYQLMQDFRSINSTLEVSAELLRGPGVFGGASLASARSGANARRTLRSGALHVPRKI